MDSGGGPGPPRPPDTPASQLPHSHDGNIGLFPFSAAATQQQSQLGHHILPNRVVMGTTAQPSAPFPTIPFMSNIRQPTPSVSLPTNNQRINPQANMLHHINAAAAVAQQSAAMQAGNLPQNLHQQQTHDFFGQLENAFASKPGQANPAATGADVLDNALAMAMVSQNTPLRQQTGTVGNQPQAQLQQARLRQQQQQHRLHQLQMQQQLQHQLQQQHHQLQHPSAIQQSIIARQHQQMHPYMRQKQLAGAQMTPRMLGPSTTLPGQAALAPGQHPQQALLSRSRKVGSHLVQTDPKIARKQQARRPRTKPDADIPIGAGTEIPDLVTTRPSNTALAQQQAQTLPSQLTFNAQQNPYQQTSTHLQQHHSGLPPVLQQQTAGTSLGTGSIQPSVASGSFPLSNSNAAMGTSTLQQQASVARGVHQSGVQRLGSAALLSTGKLPQEAPQGNPDMPKFDVATLQRVLRSTNDPKIEAAIKQQLEYLRYAAAFSGAQQLGQGPAKTLQVNSGVRTDAEDMRSIPQQGTINSHNSSHSSQAALLQRQQLLQKQQLFRQQQQLQQQQQRLQQLQQQQQQQQLQQQQLRQHQLRTHGSLPQVQQGGASRISPQGFPGLQQGGSVLQGDQSTSALPTHLRNEIQAHQLQQAQRRAQHSQSSHSQSASQGTPSDFAGEGQATGSQNSQRQSSARRPRRSPRVLRNGTDGINGIPQMPSGLAVHHGQNRVTASLSSGQDAERQATGSRHSDLEPSQTKKPGTQESDPSGPSRSPAEAVAQAAQAAQLAAGQATSANVPAVDDKRAAEDRKRIAREAELANIAVQKKRRLQTAPWNDYQRILAPDYSTPFSGLVDAWQRLVPYHVVLTDEDTCVSKEEWDGEIDKLSKKYRDCFRSLKGSLNRLFDAGFESIGNEAELSGYSSLCKDDSLILDSILLRDYYETARKQAALVEREKERRRAAEMARQNSLAQRQAFMARAAMRSSVSQMGISGNMLPVQSPKATVPNTVSASGALPPLSGPGLMATLGQRGSGAPVTSSFDAYNTNMKGVPAVQQLSAPQYVMRPSPQNALPAAGLRQQASFGAQGYPVHLPGRQPAIAASLGFPQKSHAPEFDPQRCLNPSFQHARQEINRVTLPLSDARPTATVSQAVHKQQNLASQSANSTSFQGIAVNGPQSLDTQSGIVKESASRSLNWLNSGVMTTARTSNPGTGAGTSTRMVMGGRSEIVRNGLQHNRSAAVTTSNTQVAPGSAVGTGGVGMSADVVKSSSTTQAAAVEIPHTNVNGSHHTRLNSKLDDYQVSVSGMRSSHDNFSKHAKSSGNDGVHGVNAGTRQSGSDNVGMMGQQSVASMGVGSMGIGPGGVQDLQRSGRVAVEKGASSGMGAVDGTLGLLSNRPRDQGQGSGKGGEFRGIGMGSLLNADGS